MVWIQKLLGNHMLIAALLSWATAQVIKVIIVAITQRTLDWSRLIGDGGMPSAHSATVTALAVSAAVCYGLDSGVFAVAAILAIVVMHDATGVRWEAGQHARLINLILSHLKQPLPPEAVLEELLGHTPLQVVCGALLGAGVALIYCL